MFPKVRCEAGADTRHDPARRAPGPTDTSRWSAWITCARTNLMFILLFVAGVLLRTMTMFAYRPALLLVSDAVTYLRRSVELDLSPSVCCPGVYPLMIKPLLAGGLVSVVLAQHLAALGMALLLYVLLKRRLGCPATLSALAAAPLLLDPYQMDLEQYLLTETLFELAIVGAVILLTWSKRVSLPRAAGAGALLAVATLIRYIGLVLIVPTLVYMAVSRAGLSRVLVLAAALAVPVVAYAGWAGRSGGGVEGLNKSGFFLYGRVASFADCRRIDPPPKLQRFCPVEPPGRRPAIRGVFSLKSKLTGLNVRKLFDSSTANREILDFSVRAIIAQPLDYADEVGRDLWRYFSPEPPPSREPRARMWRFPTSLKQASPARYIMLRRGSAPPQMGFEGFRIDLPLARWLRSYQNAVYLTGPLFLALIILGVLGVVIGGRAAGGHSLRAESLLFIGVPLALMVGTVMITAYHFRFEIPTIPFAGPAGALGLAAASRVGWLPGRPRPKPRSLTSAHPSPDTDL